MLTAVEGVEVAPLRSLDEFLLAKSRFETPNFNNPEKWFNRIVNNLLYYQTNYFLSSLILFSLTTVITPGQMILTVLTLSAIFGTLYIASTLQSHVRNVKKDHPLLVMISTSVIGYFIIYEVGCVPAFFLGVLLPISFIFLHASLRLRNMKSKVTSVAETLRVSKKTPMSLILAEWGLEPDVKYLN